MDPARKPSSATEAPDGQPFSLDASQCDWLRDAMSIDVALIVKAMETLPQCDRVEFTDAMRRRAQQWRERPPGQFPDVFPMVIRFECDRSEAWKLAIGDREFQRFLAAALPEGGRP